jgi:membrane-bound serine protease (ClpP class)
MGVIILLFFTGITLLALELIVPGLVLGIAGFLAMIAGVVVAFSEFGSSGGWLAALGAGLFLVAVIYAEFAWLPNSRLAKIFSMGTTLLGSSQPAVAVPSEVVGADAIAETTLAPSGYVQVAGRRYEAFCQDGFAATGARLRVRSVDNFRLIVTAV